MAMTGARILVVDDEELIRWSLAERMRAEGYDVEEAGTGAEALERARDGVDLVLLDYKLPDMDGVTVLKRIKELDADALVILLTAYASVETAVEAMKEGAFHFANKPFDLDDVAFLVARALETTQPGALAGLSGVVSGTDVSFSTSRYWDRRPKPESAPSAEKIPHVDLPRHARLVVESHVHAHDVRCHEFQAVAGVVAERRGALPGPRVIARHVDEDVVGAARRTGRNSAQAARGLVPSNVLDLDRALRHVPARRQ